MYSYYERNRLDLPFGPRHVARYAAAHPARPRSLRERAAGLLVSWRRGSAAQGGAGCPPSRPRNLSRNMVPDISPLPLKDPAS